MHPYHLRRLRRAVSDLLLCLQATNHLRRCYIALTRGSKCLKPCNVCNVLKESLNNLTLDYSLRTASDSQLHYNAALLLKTKKEKNESLKFHGLRLVYVSFSLTWLRSIWIVYSSEFVLGLELFWRTPRNFLGPTSCISQRPLCRTSITCIQRNGQRTWSYAGIESRWEVNPVQIGKQTQ